MPRWTPWWSLLALGRRLLRSRLPRPPPFPALASAPVPASAGGNCREKIPAAPAPRWTLLAFRRRLLRPRFPLPPRRPLPPRCPFSPRRPRTPRRLLRRKQRKRGLRFTTGELGCDLFLVFFPARSCSHVRDLPSGALQTLSLSPPRAEASLLLSALVDGERRKRSMRITRYEPQEKAGERRRGGCEKERRPGR